MDERYLRFPRWLEASGLPEMVATKAGPEGWLVFRRLVEQDLLENLFPDWVSPGFEEMGQGCAIPPEKFQALFLDLGSLGLLRIRNIGDEKSPFYQYRVAVPLPQPRPAEEIEETLESWGLADSPGLWRYWEPEGDQTTKYEKILRLYENTCGLKMSGRIVEDLAELAESYPTDKLDKAFEAAREEGVTTLGWIKKYLKRLKKDERIQKDRGRPRGLELPEGYSIPSREDTPGG